MTAKIQISTDKGALSFEGETLELALASFESAVDAVAEARLDAWSKVPSRYLGQAPSVVRWCDFVRFDGDTVDSNEIDQDGDRLHMAAPFETLMLSSQALKNWAVAERARLVNEYDERMRPIEQAEATRKRADSERADVQAAQRRRGAKALELLAEARALQPSCDPAVLLDDILDRIEAVQ